MRSTCRAGTVSSSCVPGSTAAPTTWVRHDDGNAERLLRLG
ncbi:hypothetical protein [Mycobacterium sp. E3198]|nr:hypothetical protein [Mycobacterium sp. E3198]